MAKSAEDRVFARLREALPATYRMFPNVRWLGKTSDEAARTAGAILALFEEQQLPE